MSYEGRKLVPLAKAEAIGLGVGRRTLGRRMKDDPDFPPVHRINGRNYIEDAQLAIYKQRLIQRAISESPRDVRDGEAA
jgi:hypothetical protein